MIAISSGNGIVCGEYKKNSRMDTFPLMRIQIVGPWVVEGIEYRLVWVLRYSLSLQK